MVNHTRTFVCVCVSVCLHFYEFAKFVKGLVEQVFFFLFLKSTVEKADQRGIHDRTSQELNNYGFTESSLMVDFRVQ